MKIFGRSLVAIYARLMAEWGAHTYCAELIVRARIYWFRCFFGTEIGLKSVFTFRTQNEVTSLPHIVLIRICIRAAEQGVLLGCARAAIRAPIVLLRGAIIAAVDLRFSCFYGTETEPDCETIFRARGGFTSSPHIVLI